MWMTSLPMSLYFSFFKSPEEGEEEEKTVDSVSHTRYLLNRYYTHKKSEGYMWPTTAYV